MKFQPRPIQKSAIDHAVEFLLTAGPGMRQGYSAPTGSGKSIIELCVQEAVNEDPANSCWIITPKEEIIWGMLDKLGCPDPENTDPHAYRISTPIKLRNMLLQGRLQPLPTHLIWDESHHEESDSWQQIGLLTGLVPVVGYTATFFRGTPKSTRSFLERWGDIEPIITMEQAARLGWISLPTFHTLPLVDDDIVQVRGGDFDITSLEAATVDRLGDLAQHSQRWYNLETHRWDRPTVYALSSVALCIRMQQELQRLHIPAAIISATTPRKERMPIFEAVEAGILALLNVEVVSEGVDLKFRRYVDAAATLSPVKFTQRLGRITRPVGEGEDPPEYWCTNRNLLRHAYILEGCVPTSAVIEAQEKFPRSERDATRVLGLEAIGRFKPTSVQLQNGLTVTMYSLSVPIPGGTYVEYCCLIHPTLPALWATKVITTNRETGKRDWGRWAKLDTPPDDLSGFSSLPPKTLSEKQSAWWKRAAANFGLDPDQEVTRKNFQALPLLADTGERFY